MNDVTRILSAINQGDARAAEQLLPLVYGELRKLASHKMGREKPGQTLQATALVHEAYIRLVDAEKAQDWNSRGHFFAAAAEAMRRILVEQSRRKKTLKAGGGRRRVELSHIEPAAGNDRVDLLALDEALERLEVKDSRKAELIKLRFFAGLTNQQAADAPNVISAVELDLFVALGGDADGDGKVWLSDWAALRANFGNANYTTPVAGAAVVPEPGTIAILLSGLAGLALFGCRRRRAA